MKNSLLFIILLLSPVVLVAQSVNQITACSGLFVDSGGENLSYSSSEDQAYLICSDDPASPNVLLNFEYIDIASGDLFCLYDGLDATAPLIKCFTTGDVGGPQILRASSFNASGCIYISFYSNLTDNGLGWLAEIECATICQRIETEISSISTDFGDFSNAEHADACLNQEIRFQGSGVYPENNLHYEQSDATSSFIWNFSDGSRAFGEQVTKQFSRSGGFNVSLEIVDEKGCKSHFLNSESSKIRISGIPNIVIDSTISNFVCQYDTLNYEASVQNTEADINIVADTSLFPVKKQIRDTLFLPDGQGVSFTSTVRFDDFLNGAILEDIDDLNEICVDIEHSYSGDLSIVIECPNGSRAGLIESSLLAQENLGEPVADNPIDGISQDESQGIPYQYCFGNASDAIELSPANSNTVTYTTLPSSDGNTYTYSDQVFLPGNYRPHGDLENLLGCPLDGEWTLIVTDHNSRDNGWIFGWSLDFDDELSEDQETFVNEIASIEWKNHKNLINQSLDGTVQFRPSEAGDMVYELLIEDDFGCEFDTLIQINVLPQIHPDCFTCQDWLSELEPSMSPCPNDTVIWQADISNNDSVEFHSYVEMNIGSSLTSPSNPVVSSIGVNSIQPSTLQDPIVQLVKVCMDLEIENTGDITAYLQAPSGNRLLLTNQIGGTGADFQNTCFTASASQSISDGAAPFTGNYLPLENWNKFDNEPINGDWSLVILDVSGTDEQRTLKHWWIEFAHDSETEISWTGNGVLCESCDSLIYHHDSGDNQVFMKVRSNGCIDSIPVQIDLRNSLDVPEIACEFQGDTLIINTLNVQSDADFYSIQVMNGDGSLLNDVSTQNNWILTGISEGDSVHIDLRALSDNDETICSSFSSSETCKNLECTLTSDISVNDATCSDLGQIVVRADSSIGEVQYFLDQQSNTTGIFDVPAGSYLMELVDEKGCRVEQEITVALNNSLNISIDSMLPTCGATDGSITINVSGGIPPFGYTWMDAPTLNTAIRNNLPAGTYEVRVRDNATPQCDTNIIIELFDPSIVVLDSVAVTNISCFGESDGSARIFLSNGSGAPSISWSDPLSSTGPTINNLESGIYQYTVTDGSCTLINAVTVSQPDSIQINNTIGDVLCAGDSTGFIDVAVLGGVPPYDFSWTGPNSFVSNDEDVQNLTGGIYSLTISDANSCEIIRDFTVLENPPLTVQLEQSDTSCIGTDQNTLVATPAGGEPPVLVRWIGGPQTPIWNNAPNGWQFVRLTDVNNCTILDSIEVFSFDSISANIIINPPSCAGNSDGQIAINTVEGGAGNGNFSDYFYEWNRNNNGDPVLTDIPGDLTYEVTITDSKGCETVLSEFLPDGDSLIIVDTLILSGCDSDTLACIEILDVENSEGDPLIYEWSNGEVGGSTLCVSQAGIYGLTVTDENGCMVSTFYEIEEFDTVSVIVSTMLPACNEEYGSAFLNISGGISPYQAEWSDGLEGLTRDSLLRGTHYVTITDQNGCSVIDSAIIFSQGDLEALTLFVDSIDCFSENYGSIEIEPVGGTFPYEYSIDGGRSFGPFRFFPDLAPGSYDIVVRDYKGCETIDTVVLIEPDPISASNFTDTTMFFGDTLILTPNITGNQGDYQIIWPDDSVRMDYEVVDDSTAIFYPINNGTYSYTVEDENGCTTEFFFLIRVDKRPRIFVPTAFTPDLSTNNLLGILGDEGVFIEEFRIFDRWGEIVYENTEFFIDNSPQGWNGQLNDTKCQPGIYTWYAIFIYTDGLEYKTSGHTMLFR